MLHYDLFVIISTHLKSTQESKLDKLHASGVVFKPGLCISMQTLTTVHHRPVKTEAPASTESTPFSASAQTAGREVCVMSVSVCVCAYLSNPTSIHIVLQPSVPLRV